MRDAEALASLFIAGEKTNAAFWRDKIARNRARDADVLNRLDAIGWRSIVLWECGLGDRDARAERLQAFLGPPRA